MARTRPRGGGSTKILPSGGHSFFVKDFSTLDENSEDGKQRSDVFEALNRKWYVLVWIWYGKY